MVLPRSESSSSIFVSQQGSGWLADDARFPITFCLDHLVSCWHLVELCSVHLHKLSLWFARLPAVGHVFVVAAILPTHDEWDAGGKRVLSPHPGIFG